MEEMMVNDAPAIKVTNKRKAVDIDSNDKDNFSRIDDGSNNYVATKSKSKEEEVVFPSCPYLDTIQRSVLDFDFEISCSVSLERSYHIYGCLVCGKYFRGKGPNTPAYIHSIECKHFVFVHLIKGTFHCLPDNYEIRNESDIASLKDIRDALYPKFTLNEIKCLDTIPTPPSNHNNNHYNNNNNNNYARDLFGRKYIPGFVGLNNLNKTDYVNVTIQALAHVKPLRDYFLKQSLDVDSTANTNNTPTNHQYYYDPQLLLEQSSSSSSLSNSNNYKMACYVTFCFGELIRKMWSSKRFKSHVDPHVFIQAISISSKKKYHIGKQIEIGEFISWLLHQLHIGCKTRTIDTDTDKTTTKTDKTGSRNGKKKKAGTKTKSSFKRRSTSIIHEIFQGKLQVTKRMQKKALPKERGTNDDRGGSDTEPEEENLDRKVSRGGDEDEKCNYEEIIQDTKFLQLTLDIPEKPLFRDDDGGLVIPQEPLVTVLKKFDGVTFSDVLLQNRNKSKSSANKQNSTSVAHCRYRLLELPSYLILHLGRFKTTNQYTREKNPTIVVFPVKNLDLSEYVYTNDGSSATQKTTKKKKKLIPTQEEIRCMSVKQLKDTLIQNGLKDILKDCEDRNIIEKSELVEIVQNHMRSLSDTIHYKYDLIANITHNSITDVGKERKNINSYDPLQDGYYKCHVQHNKPKQWYEIQDLHVTEIMPQLIGLSESYVLIFERKK